MFERLDLLYKLDVPNHLGGLGDLIVRRYARRLANRPPSVGARIKEPGRTVEVACFLRYCLFTATDQAILMIQRRVADLWRQASSQVVIYGNNVQQCEDLDAVRKFKPNAAIGSWVWQAALWAA